VQTSVCKHADYAVATEDAPNEYQALFFDKPIFVRMYRRYVEKSTGAFADH